MESERTSYADNPACDIHTRFSLMFHFYTLWKGQRTKGFLTFSGGAEMEHQTKKICGIEILQQLPWLEIRVTHFRQSTILQNTLFFITTSKIEA